MSKPTINKIADIREASFLNGLTLVAPSSACLFASDTALGVVWRINHHTGEYKIVLDSTLMKQDPKRPTVAGINGIHTRNEYAYFVNSAQGILARVPISRRGRAAGPYEVVPDIGLSDDFAFDSAGNTYVAQGPGNALEQSR